MHLGILLCGVAALFLFVFQDISLAARHPTAKTPERYESINIVVPDSLIRVPVVQLAVKDTRTLLSRGFPNARITLNAQISKVRIVLPDPEQMRNSPSPGPKLHTRYPLLHSPWQGYRWDSHRRKDFIELRLLATSPQGVACGLYGLLQERLGFKFIHPRQTIFPRHNSWPLPPDFHWNATPRFEKRGFHLHTLHPTELSEQLNNPEYPSALADVKEYLDWLARNGQNVMQFYLLRGADTDNWADHAQHIVAYAHSRGIMVGVAFSLSMIQQRAFQLLHLFRPFPSYRSQIDASLASLFRVKWDFVTLEPTMGEYLPDLGSLLPETTDYLVREVTGRYRTRLFYATHVIRRKSERSSTPHSEPDSSGPGTGSLIHTVMNYAVTDTRAPVYGNKNLGFMFDRAVLEMKNHETWYWPESSYWVAYDSSVPLFLLTYLDARWRDMKTMEKIGIPGHLTFSSGWEWGYWLVDWSISRWTWRYDTHSGVRLNNPLSTLEELFPYRSLTLLWKEALALENHYLKNKELIRYLAAATPFSELPSPFRKSFQPTPAVGNARLFHGVAKEEQTAAEKTAIELDEYAGRLESLVQRLAGEIKKLSGRKPDTPSELWALASELESCLAVSALRARHRALTLRALLSSTMEAGHGRNPAAKREMFLKEAAEVRLKGIELVQKQERHYRYSVALLAGQRESMTAYRFGYLYPTSSLFFWKREEEQIRQGRFHPFFMNLWDFQRVLGLGSLF
jgi:hypothetical protein